MDNNYCTCKKGSGIWEGVGWALIALVVVNGLAAQSTHQWKWLGIGMAGLLIICATGFGIRYLLRKQETRLGTKMHWLVDVFFALVLAAVLFWWGAYCILQSG